MSPSVPIRPLQTRSRLIFCGAALLAAVFALVIASPAHAITTVNCAPYGSDDLDDAISNAASGATIVVNGTCTGSFGIGAPIVLQGGLSPHTLNGNGVEATVRIFNETNGGNVVVALKGLTIKNGEGSYPYGGGISISEPKIDVTLVNTVVTGSHSNDFGGGIEMGAFDQTLKLIHSGVVDNVADSRGGGVYMGEPDEVATLTSSIVSGNTAQGDGGGFSIDDDGSLTLTNSLVSGNSARYDGGGIMNSLFGGAGGASITLNGSTVSGNTAAFDDGGGIDMHDTGALTLTNSTVASNVAAGDGGGINVESNQVTIDA